MLKNILLSVLILIALFILKITYNTEVYTRERQVELAPRYQICYPKEEQKVIKDIFDCPAQK